jgi:hypothetical protein
MLVGVVPALGVAVEMASSVSGGLGQSAFRAEKRLKSITIMVTGLVERLRAKHVGFSLKISAIKAKIMSDLDRVTDHLKNVGASFVALYHRKGDCGAKIGKKRKTDNRATSSSVCGDTLNDYLIADYIDPSGELKHTKVEEIGRNGINEDLMKYAADTQKVVGASN